MTFLAGVLATIAVLALYRRMTRPLPALFPYDICDCGDVLPPIRGRSDAEIDAEAERLHGAMAAGELSG